MTHVTDLEREYSPSSRVGGSAEPFIQDYAVRSRAAEARLAAEGREITLLHGGTRLVVGEAGAPLLVFVHGGYWQALSAADSMYLAPGAAARGWSYAAVEYTLAPDAALGQIVHEVRGALQALDRADGFGPVVLAGHSAGAHLVAMTALMADSPLPVAQVVLLSGVYDLRPIVHTTVNDVLHLDAAGAAALSPTLLPVAATPPVLVAIGDNETDAFHAQSHVFAARLRAAGAPVTELIVSGRHHFDIVDDLVDPTSAVGALVLGGSPS